MSAQSHVVRAVLGATALAGMAAATLVGLVQPALAAEPAALSAVSMSPGAAASDGWLTRGADRVQPGVWSARLLGHYSRLPARVSAGNQHQTVVGDLWLVELGGHVGLPAGWSAGAQLPAAAVVRGGGPNLLQLQESPLAPALGDLRIDVRKHLQQLAFQGGALHLAARLGLTLPTASAGQFVGGAPGAEAEALGSWLRAALRVDASLGLRAQTTQAHKVRPVLASGQIDPSGRAVTVLQQGPLAAVLRLGAGHAFAGERLVAKGEVQWLAPIASGKAGHVVDLAASAGWMFQPGWQVQALLGTSPTSALASAALRVGVGLQVLPERMASDTDRDGVDDRQDRCPTAAEDKDGFADADGCPDPDNDADGVPDSADRCPLQAEDGDGFDDADGCPDPDNDADGVADTADACPAQPEDRDGFDDADGCPDLDDDADGMPDADDLCPLQPETKNGFEDADGCPDTPPAPPPAVEAAPAAAPVAPPAPVKGKAVKPAKAGKSGRGK